MALHVLKFGGTSVGSVAAIRATTEIVRVARAEAELVLVVSAMSGVTDTLLRGAYTAASGDGTTFGQLATELEARHTASVIELVPDERERETVTARIRGYLKEFRTLCHGIHVLGELTPRALDMISSLGERLNAPQVAAALRAAGVPASAVDAAEVIVTNDRFGDATPDLALTKIRADQRLRPLLERKLVPVVTGFLGATPAGVTTTLGRGGSDYSAAIIGAALEADEVVFYKEVDGVMTGDPQLVPDARVLPLLSYDEISELAYFGAKVLHPKAIQPLVDRGIAVRFKNTFNPSYPGSVIVPKATPVPGTIKAVTAIRGLSLVTVAGRGMLGVPGIAARTFGAVAQVNASVLMISQASSEQSICFALPTAITPAVVAALRDELGSELERRDIDGVGVDDNTVILTVVGAGLRGTPGVAGRIFTVLGEAGINIHAIALGSSECSISLVVDAADADNAVRAAHQLTVLAA
ncbi:MAG: aspartate kinase [Herpetosiphonaceae bacterium]|nr:aspartate kinase [Herpetosiphonaceae bacterium]